MQKGHHVIHKQTGRAGRVESFGNTLPTTVNVRWISANNITSHEANELEFNFCNKEHSMYPGYFCAMSKGHTGWCNCN